MKWLIAMSVAVAAGMGLPSAASADPGGPNLQAPARITCDNGAAFTVNPGTLTNRGRVAWVVDSNSVMVTASLAVTDGTNTFILFDSKRGLQHQGGLVTCRGDVGGGYTVIATGFFTPR